MEEKLNNPQQVILTSIEPYDQIVVKTANSTYVFLYESLYFARLVQCSNQTLDLGNVSLLGSYAEWKYQEEYAPIASGRLVVGEQMAYHYTERDCNNEHVVITSAIRELQLCRSSISATRPYPGLIQPRSGLQQLLLQNQAEKYNSGIQTLLTPKSASSSSKSTSPELWTPHAPVIPQSSPPETALKLT